MKEIKFARVRDFLGFNSLIISPTSRVIRDEHLPESVKNGAKLRDQVLVDEALGGKPSPALRRAYAIMIGLSSHDLSAMRELLGMPNKVLYAALRGDGLYLSAAFDYGSFVCQFETGIDEIARFDAHLEVYGTQKVGQDSVRYALRPEFADPTLRNRRQRARWRDTSGFTSCLGRSFCGRMEGILRKHPQGKAPKTGPADFGKDLELFAEMARLMREP